MKIRSSRHHYELKIYDLTIQFKSHIQVSVLLSQVTYIYIALYTIQMQLHINKKENNSVNDVKWITYETISISAVMQLYRR